MFNKIKQLTKQPKTTSKFFQSVVLTGTMLLFILKPGISKANEEVKIEIQKTLQNKNQTYKVKETIKDDNKTYNTINKQGQFVETIPPDTTAIKSFFLDGGFLTPDEVKDFNSMRRESTKSPSRPAIYLTICDERETATNDYEKAVFITSFLDPFQKTALGKSAFQIINTEPGFKSAYETSCQMYILNIKLIKVQKENELAKKENELAKKENELAHEALELLTQIEMVYKQYLDK